MFKYNEVMCEWINMSLIRIVYLDYDTNDKTYCVFACFANGDLTILNHAKDKATMVEWMYGFMKE